MFTVWNKLVDNHDSILHDKEEVAQRKWEEIFADSFFFGYSKALNEIVSQECVKTNRTRKERLDIVIKKQPGNIDLFIVELKKQDNITKEDNMIQLETYMKQKECDIGLLIDSQITIIVRNLFADKSWNSVTIPFKHDEINGKEFIELFKRDNFDKNKIYEFVKNISIHNDNIEKIKDELKEENIKNILISKLEEKYSIEEIKEVIEDYKITIEKKNNIPRKEEKERKEDKEHKFPTFQDMIEQGVININDQIRAKRNDNIVGTIIDGKNVLYNNETMSYCRFACIALSYKTADAYRELFNITKNKSFIELRELCK